MSSIEKQRSGRYRARYRDPNGRTRSVTFDRVEEARRFLAGLGGDLTRSTLVNPARARTNFEEWAELWWGTTVRLRPTTRRGYRGLLDRHVLPYFAGRKLRSMVPRLSNCSSPTATGLACRQRWYRGSLSVLSMVLQLAVKANGLATNAAVGHRVPVRRRVLQEGDVLDMAQVVQLVAHVRDPYKPAVWLLALGGLRPSELCGLRVRNVDSVRHTVTVRSTLTQSTPSPERPPGSARGRLRQAPVITPSRYPRGCAETWRPCWRHVEKATATAGYFRTRYGTPVNCDHFRDKVVIPALRAAGLTVTIRTYDLRHSHASLQYRPRGQPVGRRAEDGPQRPQRDVPRLWPLV